MSDSELITDLLLLMSASRALCEVVSVDVGRFRLGTVSHTTRLRNGNTDHHLHGRGLIPTVVCNNGRRPATVSVGLGRLMGSLRFRTFFSRVLAVGISNRRRRTIVGSLRHRPTGNFPVRTSFRHVIGNRGVRVGIPIRFANHRSTPNATTTNMLSALMSSVRVVYLPSRLPRCLRMSMSNVRVNSLFHLSSVGLPRNIIVRRLRLRSNRSHAVIGVRPPAIRRISRSTRRISTTSIPTARRSTRNRARSGGSSRWWAVTV